MMNFWISLYVTIVITLAGSAIDGVQISRIGSQDQDLWTQDGPQDGPTTPGLKNFKSAPDEQQSDLQGANLTNKLSQLPGPPTGTPYTDRDSNINYKTPTDQTPRKHFVKPHEKCGTDPNGFDRQFPTGKKQQFPIILYSIQYSLFEVNGIQQASTSGILQASRQKETLDIHKTSRVKFESGYLK